MFQVSHSYNYLNINCNYYPGGMIMPGRFSTSGDYRYGYNGMEMDNETSGNGNSYTTEFRQYDPRLMRWKSLDPLMAQFPWMSPYVAFDNNPIVYTDPYGLSAGTGDGGPPTQKTDENGNKTDWEDMDVYYEDENGTLIKYRYVINEDGSSKWYRTETHNTMSSVDAPGKSKATQDKEWNELVKYTFEHSGTIKRKQIGVSNEKDKEVLSTYSKSNTKKAAATVGVLLADDVTGVGVVDDVLLPFAGLALLGSAVHDALIPDVVIYSTKPSLSIPIDIPIDYSIIDENALDPPVDYFIHYTNDAGLAGIVTTGVIIPNSKGKVYMTKDLMSPKSVEDNIFIGASTHTGKGANMIIFYVTASQRAQIMSDPQNFYQYIYKGTLRITNQIMYWGPNPNK